MLRSFTVMHSMYGRRINKRIQDSETANGFGVYPGLVVKYKYLKPNDQQWVEAEKKPWDVEKRRGDLRKKAHPIGQRYVIQIAMVVGSVMQAP